MKTNTDIKTKLFPISEIYKTFPHHEYYIGGSFAQSIYFNGDVLYNDIDVFINGPRICETKYFIRVLNLFFDKVELPVSFKVELPVSFTKAIENKELYYRKIKGQYCLIHAYKNGLKYDIILLTTDDILSTMGSTLSKIVYHFKPYNTYQQLHLMQNNDRDFLLHNRIVVIDKNQNTEKQMNKVLTRCKTLSYLTQIV